MPTSTTAPTSADSNPSAKRRSASPAKPASPGKNKGKSAATDDVQGDLEDDEEDEDEDEEEEEEDDDDEEDEDEMDLDDDEGETGRPKEQIDPKAILPPGARRSARGKRIDYSSAEALQRAGLKSGELEDEEMD